MVDTWVRPPVHPSRSLGDQVTAVVGAAAVARGEVGAQTEERGHLSVLEGSTTFCARGGAFKPYVVVRVHTHRCEDKRWLLQQYILDSILPNKMIKNSVRKFTSDSKMS